MNYDRTPFETDKPGEECGVFGAYDFDGHDISSSIYYGLFALQHRGQESCGIAVSDTEGPKGKVDYYKDMGLVNEVFDEERLNRLHGNIGVGHGALLHRRREQPRKRAAAHHPLYQGHAGRSAQRAT